MPVDHSRAGMQVATQPSCMPWECCWRTICTAWLGPQSTTSAARFAWQKPGHSWCLLVLAATSLYARRPLSCWHADCNAAILHALGLLLAHTLYSLAMHQQSRGSMVRTGPQGLAFGAAEERPASATRATFFWAALQVRSPVSTHPDRRS